MSESDIADRIAERIKEGESNNLEFKSKLPDDHKKYLKTVVSFSNTVGGMLLFGVNNDGSIAGIPDEEVFIVKDSIADSITNSRQPQIVPEMYIVTVEGLNVIVVQMMIGTNGPYFIKSEGRTNGTYIRVGATNRVADPNRIKALELRSMNMSFDGLDCPSVKADERTIKELCDRLSSFKGAVTQTDLLNMGVIKEGSMGYLATNAFALLTKNPYIHARVQCARFRGNDDLVFQDSRDFTGDIVGQVVGALDFVLNNIQMHSKIDGLVRDDYYEIPKNALREAIANAVLHREYLMTDSSIFVKIFDDRIEIESPGLPLGLNISDAISGRSIIRNQVIAYVFKSIGFIERYGTGIRRMIAECEQNNVPKPRFTADGEYFIVTFLRSEVQKEKAKRSFGTVEEKKNAILDLMERLDSGYTQTDISTITGISLSDVKRTMLNLQKEGLLERKGNKRNSEWIVKRR